MPEVSGAVPATGGTRELPASRLVAGVAAVALIAAGCSVDRETGSRTGTGAAVGAAAGAAVGLISGGFLAATLTGAAAGAAGGFVYDQIKKE